MKNFFAVAFIRDKKILFLEEEGGFSLPVGEILDRENTQKCICRMLLTHGVTIQEGAIQQTECCGIRTFDTDEHIHLYLGDSNLLLEKEAQGTTWLTRLGALQKPNIPSWIVLAIGELRSKGLV